MTQRQLYYQTVTLAWSTVHERVYLECTTKLLAADKLANVFLGNSGGPSLLSVALLVSASSWQFGWSEPFLDSSAPLNLSEVFPAYIHQGERDLANMISLRDFPKFGLFTS